MFSKVGNEVETFVRFSTVAGERGAADAERDIPKTYRHMHGFGSHTFSLINDAGERHWVKFHLRTQQGIENLTDREADALIGEDRESHQRDLYEAVERGDYPKRTLYVQLMPEADAATYRFHPFDLTKVWSKKDYPLVEGGELELNRNPENYFADVEQAAFTPANLVPGISVSPDKMLPGRLFSYGDATRYRLGVNHHQIPVNCPHAATLVNTYHRDGATRVDGNQGGVPGVRPNSFGRWAEQPQYAEPAGATGAVADRFDYREDDDNLFRLLDGGARQRLSRTRHRGSRTRARRLSIGISTTAPRRIRLTALGCGRRVRRSGRCDRLRIRSPLSVRGTLRDSESVRVPLTDGWQG
ncbi:catalase [Amycolatopsis halotolerans]|uniref:catalase n=1 Tax=Amycolatopsis halotolerans TaxID=330083 RepID=UPI00406BC40D